MQSLIWVADLKAEERMSMLASSPACNIEKLGGAWGQGYVKVAVGVHGSVVRLLAAKARGPWV